MYYGSMHGKPPLFFAVWGYILGHMQPTGTDERVMSVELNPELMSSVFGGREVSPPAEILKVIEELCSPDPRSRTQIHEGRRLLTTDREPGLGPCTYIVVNEAADLGQCSKLEAGETIETRVTIYAGPVEV